MRTRSIIWYLITCIIFFICNITDFYAQEYCNNTENEEKIYDQFGDVQLVPSKMCISINEEILNEKLSDNTIITLIEKDSINQDLEIIRNEEKLEIKKEKKDIEKKDDFKSESKKEVMEFKIKKKNNITTILILILVALIIIKERKNAKCSN